jgi:hydroxymethylpyrimidine/phosphomethylpyrimidine kinase
VRAVLVIAGSDSSGGAGIARDLRTLAELGMPAACALTAVTAQTDAALLACEVLRPQLVRAQIESAFATHSIAAVKIGMLANADTVRSVAQALALHSDVPSVLDPVLLSSSGAVLLNEAGRCELLKTLLPQVTLLTPNIPEAALLLGEARAASEAQLLRQGQELRARGARAVLIKGGHAEGPDSVDLLISAQGVERLQSPRLASYLRGTGCALASAIAAYLGQGFVLAVACRQAKQYLSALLQQAL